MKEFVEVLRKGFVSEKPEDHCAAGKVQGKSCENNLICNVNGVFFTEEKKR